MNIQSLYKNEAKRAAICAHISTEDIDVMLLTETHEISKSNLTSWIHYNEDTNISANYTIITDHSQDIEQDYKQSKGIAIIMKRKWSKYIQIIHTLPGRVTSLLLRIQKNSILLAAVYLPTYNLNNKA